MTIIYTMLAIRKHTDALALFALALCLMAASQVECNHCELCAQLKQLIRVPYPEVCSVSHVNSLFHLESALLSPGQSDDTHQGETATIGRFNTYLQLLPEYCNKLFDLKLAKKENFDKFHVNYGEVTDLSEQMSAIEKSTSAHQVSSEDFLNLLGEFLEKKSAQKRISKEEALVSLRRAAKELALLIYNELAPILALKMLAGSVAEQEGPHTQEAMSTLTKQWVEISEHLNQMRLANLDTEGHLTLNPFLLASEEEEEDFESKVQPKSALAPLETHLVQQITQEEGYQRKFDELVSGM